MIKAIKIKGYKIEYWHKGKGATLFFFHGAFGSFRFYMRLLNILSSKYSVYAPSLPGMGKSESPQGEPSFQMYAEIIHEFINKFSNKNKYLLMGHSLGAAIIVYLDKLHKINPEQIILLNVPILKVKNYIHRTAVGWTSLIISHLLNIRKLKFSEIIPWDAINIVFFRTKDFFKIITALKKAGELQKSVRGQGKSSNYQIFTSSDDKYVLPENSEVLHKETKNSKLCKVSRGGHVWFMYNPEKLLRELEVKL